MKTKDIPEFTQQDIGLLMAYNKIKHLKITKVEDLKAGLYVNVRDTLSLSNSYCPVILLDGKPNKRNSLKSFCFDKSAFASAYEIYDEKTSMFVGTMIEYNTSFRYNTKVVEFIKKLQEADRFQQHCIIGEHPYTLKTYDHFCSIVSYNEACDSFERNIDYGESY